MPAYLMNTREGYGKAYFKLKNWPSGMQFGYIFLAMLSFMPLMSLIGHWNESLQLPDNMQSLQRWMERSEKESADLIKVIIMESSVSGFLYNIVILALIPAIGEELLFRGVLQKIMGRWLSNQHVVIWLVAIIFSAIHLQFFGFVPRMLLGAFFGYLYVWSKNIVLPIFGHFVNNAGATIGAFYYVREGKSYDEFNAFELQSWWIYLVGFIFTLIFVFLFYRSTQKKIMENDWKKIKTYTNAIQAEIVKQMLEENGIPTVAMNKQDSSYLFGKIELYVSEGSIDLAETLIEEAERGL